MARLIKPQRNFNAGELSPRLHARSDVSKYDNGLETATNFFATPHGPLERRNGTQYIAEIKTSSKTVRLLRFQFSQSNAFILEFGDLYIRFFKDSAVVGAPYEIVSPYAEADLSEIRYVQFGNKLYLAHPDYAPRVLTRNGDTDWDIAELNPIPEPTEELGESPSTTCTPGATTGLGVTFTAGSAVFLDGDVGRQIVNLSGAGRASITSVGTSPSTTATCDIVEDFPSTSAIASGDWQLDLSPIADLTFDGTATGSIVTIDADLPDSTTASDTFRTTDVGKYIIAHNGVIQITERVSGSQVNGEVLKSLDAKTETANWTLEDSDWSASRGYPQAIGLFEQRLWFGGTTTKPQTIWASETGIFDGFGGGDADSDSLDLTISSSEVNEIKWMAASRDLVVGTSGSEITINSASTSGITPSTAQQLPRTYYGSEAQQTINIGSEIGFIQRNLRKIRSFRYDFDIDNYAGENLTFLAEHMPATDIVEMAYAQEPDSAIYAVLTDGNMIVGTYDRRQEVIGWTRYTTDGSFENVQTISVNEADQVWVVVKRTINGTTKRYIELFDTGEGLDRLDGFSDSFLTYSDPKTITGITQANPAVVTTSAAHGYSNGDTVKLLDVVGMTEVIGKTYTVANATSTTYELSGIDSTGFTAYTSGGESHKLVTTVSGLDHLEGKTVQVKADGAAHADKTVSSGSITLDQPTYEVVVGLSYTATFTTLNKEFDIGQGSMQGQRSRYVRPILRVNNSVKPVLNDDILPSRSAGDRMDEAVPLFTGDLEYGAVSWGTTGQLTFSLSQPFPLQVLAIFGTLEGNVK